MATKKTKENAKQAVNRGCAGLFFFLMLVMGSIWGAGLGVFVWVLEDAKTTIEALEEFRPNIGSRVYSSDGELLGQFTIEERQLVPLNEMPLHLVKAFLATEDHPFYEHKGVRPDAIISAALTGLQSGRFRGASTITQQVAKNVLLWPGRDPVRKLLEATLTPQLELFWNKRRIMEVYLNVAETGPGLYGAEAAARRYFHRSAAELTRRQAALIAAVLPNPRLWSAAEPSRYIRRRADVIERRIGQLGPLLDCID